MPCYMIVKVHYRLSFMSSNTVYYPIIFSLAVREDRNEWK